MTKIEQMNELIFKVQKDEALQKEIEAIMQNETAEDIADKWLADHGYSFNLKELNEHLADGIPLSEDQLEAVAGGGKDHYPRKASTGTLINHKVVIHVRMCEGK